MKLSSNVFLFVLLGLATLAVGCASTSEGTGATTSNCSVSAVNTDPNRVAQGTQGDSLEACLSSIPCDASAGQRHVATLTCERDAKARQPLDVDVPGK